MEKQMYNPYEILPNFIAPQSYCYIDDIELTNNK